MINKDVTTIRPAREEDLKFVYGLLRQLSRHDFTMEQFERSYLYNLRHNHILVYERNKNICGCGVLMIHYPLHFSRKTAEVVNLVVDEHARGQGIGKELLTAFMQIALDNACVNIEVDSGKHRKAAHRFYYREGFVCDHYKLTRQMD
ncbi:MAG: GNAT family N-acetyltransferase [Peptococcaceae bacterium]|nr:GNAT family N-acetyltransferase [Peptococcaceae bacterium]